MKSFSFACRHCHTSWRSSLSKRLPRGAQLFCFMEKSICRSIIRLKSPHSNNHPCRTFEIFRSNFGKNLNWCELGEYTVTKVYKQLLIVYSKMIYLPYRSIIDSFKLKANESLMAIITPFFFALYEG